MIFRVRHGVILFFAGSLLHVLAFDWPQWRGPARTGHVPEGEAVPDRLTADRESCGGSRSVRDWRRPSWRAAGFIILTTRAARKPFTRLMSHRRGNSGARKLMTRSRICRDPAAHDARPLWTTTACTRSRARESCSV